MINHHYYMDIQFGDALFSVLCFSTTPEENLASLDLRLLDAMHNHPYYEMHIFKNTSHEDSGHPVVIHDHAFTVPAGCAVIIAPDTDHMPIDPMKHIVLSFQLTQTGGNSGFFSYFRKSLTRVCDEWIIIPIPDTLISAVHQFHQIVDTSQIGNYCMKKSLAYNIITSLFQQIDHFDSNNTVSPVEFDAPLQLSLHQSLIDNPQYSQQEIADRIGYSLGHTKRLIQQIYGKGFRTLRQEQRIRIAKQYLANSPEMTIREIAFGSGFSNTEAMRAAFQKYEGCSPQNYRKQHQNKPS